MLVTGRAPEEGRKKGVGRRAPNGVALKGGAKEATNRRGFCFLLFSSPSLCHQGCCRGVAAYWYIVTFDVECQNFPGLWGRDNVRACTLKLKPGGYMYSHSHLCADELAPRP